MSGRLTLLAGSGGLVDEVAAAAEAALARQNYCLWRNNCEHFATECKTGRRHSRQVRRALHIFAGTAGAAVAVLLPLLVMRRTATD